MSPRASRGAPAVTILVEDPDWRSEKSILVQIRRAAKLALDIPPRRKREGGGRDVAILLAGDEHLRELNHTFRGRNKPTNVLSFESLQDIASHLGDVALAYDIVAKEARDQAKTLGAHAAHLTIHGILHLLGYDHQDEAEAERMESLETELVQRLGFSDPYAPVRCTQKPKAA